MRRENTTYCDGGNGENKRGSVEAGRWHNQNDIWLLKMLHNFYG